MDTPLEAEAAGEMHGEQARISYILSGAHPPKPDGTLMAIALPCHQLSADPPVEAQEPPAANVAGKMIHFAARGLAQGTLCR